MKPEEAIKILKVAKAECEWNAPLEYQAAFDAAFEALEKQIPKKPYTNVIHYPYTSDLTTVQCPNCKRRLRTRRTQAKGDRFCPDCGQKICWEDVELYDE